MDTQATTERPLSVLLDLLSPTSEVAGRRNIHVLDSHWVSHRHLRDALPDLADPGLTDALTAAQLAALAKLAMTAPQDEREALLIPLRSLLSDRWNDLNADLVWLGLSSFYTGRELFSALPQLTRSTEIYEVISEQEDSTAWVIDQALPLDQVVPPHAEQLRRLLPRMTGRNLPDLATAALAAAGRTGWSSWLTMATILWRFEDLAQPLASGAPPSAPKRSEALAWAHDMVWRAVHGDAAGRALGRLLLDLRGELSRSPPDFKDVYVDRLQAVIGDDADLRRAALEGLLWAGQDRARDIAVYAAAHLARNEDRETLRRLETHPDRRVQYSAGLVGRMIDGATFRSLPEPTSHAPSTGPERSGSRTWLGDARLEQAIEDTVKGLEERFADEYALRHKAGEDRLGERFFAILGERFERLEAGLADLAAARGEAHRAAVQVGYRPVDRGEEGDPGITPPGQSEPSESFAADFCLIVTAVLNGKPLAKRAVLVQAKRLYLQRNAEPARGWQASFNLKPKQTRSLIFQSASSIFVFQGPATHGRKLATLPARLVDDLARHQAASGAVIAADTVDQASESFAEWFTYQFLALRTGDPFAKLMEKAEGGSPQTPYDLVRWGVIDVEVRVDEPKEERD